MENCYLDYLVLFWFELIILSYIISSWVKAKGLITG